MHIYIYIIYIIYIYIYIYVYVHIISYYYTMYINRCQLCDIFGTISPHVDRLNMIKQSAFLYGMLWVKIGYQWANILPTQVVNHRILINPLLGVIDSSWLVVDLPLWKIWKSVGMIVLHCHIWKNKTCSKPPTRFKSPYLMVAIPMFLKNHHRISPDHLHAGLAQHLKPPVHSSVTAPVARHVQTCAHSWLYLFGSYSASQTWNWCLYTHTPSSRFWMVLTHPHLDPLGNWEIPTWSEDWLGLGSFRY